MFRRLEILGEQWVNERLEFTRQVLELPLRQKYPSAYRGMPVKLKAGVIDPQVLNAALRINAYLEQASLQTVAGVATPAVRSGLHRAAELWLPVVGAFASKDLRQLIIGLEKALCAAAISGDRDLARRIAAHYPVPRKVDARGEARIVILRHFLADDDGAALRLAEKMQPGYPLDYPPERIELPQGIARGDNAQVAKGLKAINTRFRGKWDLRKYRAWHEEQVAKRQHHGKIFQPWSKSLDDVRVGLFNYGWLLSVWGLAMLNVARWRGMSGVFENDQNFSEWLPRELTETSKEGE